MENREIEAKFLEINKHELITKLKSLGAEDWGEDLLKEMIFHDAAGKWKESGRTFVRIRSTERGVRLTYKNGESPTATGTEEIEFGVDDIGKARMLLEKIGLVLSRDQEKRRHTFKLGDVMFDIDTWPRVPTYVEVEGPSEELIREASEKLGFDWKSAIFGNAQTTIEKYYHIPVRKLRFFTFYRVE